MKSEADSSYKRALARGALAQPFDVIVIGSGATAATLIPAIAADLASGNSARAIERAARLRDANRGVADAHILLGDAALRIDRILVVEPDRGAGFMTLKRCATPGMASSFCQAARIPLRLALSSSCHRKIPTG